MQIGRRRPALRPARSLALAVCGVVALGCVGAAPAQAHARTAAATAAFSLKPLSIKDARTYASAFAAVRDGRFEAADALAKTVSDHILLGRLSYAKLMHPDYSATYDELADWLERYRDQPDADRVYTLARKRRPGAAPALPEAAEGADAAIWARVESLAQRVEAASPTPTPPPAPVRTAAVPTRKVDAALQAAREAYYGGAIERGYTLAVKAGERWIAGLAAFRMKKYDEARSRFAGLAEDETENEWVRSGAGYWAARAAVASGTPEAAPHYLGLAAKTPYTFYGLIAERQLGLDPAVTAEGLDPALAPSPLTSTRGAAVVGPGGASVAGLVKADKRARRAAAFTQLGMKAEAGAELRAGLMGAAGAGRMSWTRLGLALNAPLTSPSDLSRGRRTRFDIAQYPTPDLAPQGGFTLDKALVYALVRQESRFNSDASSASGAYGLMQLMPATAARVAGDDKLKSNPSLLKDPAVNLRLGQDYVTRLLSALNGDLLHAVAAYNSGPGVIQKTLTQLGKNADSLLAIESMPGAQTREYVEKVVAGYWIYRNIFGQDSPTLDAAASARRGISAALDQSLAPTLTARIAPDVLAGLLAPAAAQ